MRGGILLISLLFFGSILAACGEGDLGVGAAVDAGPDDNPTDAGRSFDAQRANVSKDSVSVHVSEGSEPKRFVTVLFHDADGVIVGEAQTDNRGRVVRSPAPSYVTIVDDDFGEYMTFAGVEPGDVLTVTGMPSPNLPPRDVIGRFLVTLPSEVSGAVGYTAEAGACLTDVPRSTTTFVVNADSWCAHTASGVLAAASRPDGTTMFAWKTGLEPKGETTVPVTLGPWTPANETTFVVNQATRASATLFARLADGEEFFLARPSGSSFPVPNGFAFSYTTQLKIEDTNQNTSVALRNTSAGPFEANEEDLLPCPSSAEIVQVGERFHAQWTYSGPAPRSGATLYILREDMPDGRLAGGWTLIVPPGETRVRLPQLPEYAGTPAHVTFVSLLDSDVIDFREMRRTPTVFGGQSAFATRFPPTVGLRSRWVQCWPQIH